MEKRHPQPAQGKEQAHGESVGWQGSRRGPRNYQRSDERIREDVCERLMQDEGLDVSEVSVEVREANVTLEGTVPSRPMKHAVEDIAASVRGVNDVENRLRVAPAASTAPVGLEHGGWTHGSSAGTASGTGSPSASGVAGTGYLPTSGTSRTGSSKD